MFIKNHTKTEIPSRYNAPAMFDRIARRYDLLNHGLSAGQDWRWRKTAARQLPAQPNQIVLDLATGTADLLLTAMKTNSQIITGIGIDPAEQMLRLGKAKIAQLGFANRITLLRGDGIAIPLSSNSVDGVMIAFGIRNVPDFNRCLQEIYRVLKPGGRLVVLEFSLPTKPIFRNLYLLYFRHVLPLVGGLISGDGYAYHYLNQTVETFYYGKAFCEQLASAGFTSVKLLPLTCGIASIYLGDKNDL